MSTTGTLHTPKQVADRRAQAPHTSMFARMLLRAAVLRRRRAAAALLAMVVAAAVATAMMNLYVDVQAKLRTEFRNYGANVVIVGKDGQSLARRRAGQSRIRYRPRRKDAGCSFLLRRRSHQRRAICSRRRHRLHPRPPVEPLVEGEPLARRAKPSPHRHARRECSQPQSPALRTHFPG